VIAGRIIARVIALRAWIKITSGRRYFAKYNYGTHYGMLIDSNEKIRRNTSRLQNLHHRCFPLVFFSPKYQLRDSCILLHLYRSCRVYWCITLVLYFVHRHAPEFLMRREEDFNKCAKAVSIEFYWLRHPFDLYVITFYCDAWLPWNFLKSALHFTRA